MTFLQNGWILRADGELPSPRTVTQERSLRSSGLRRAEGPRLTAAGSLRSEQHQGSTVAESRFVGSEAWMLAVTRALHCATALQELEATGLDPEALLRIARVEASWAGANGICMLSHERLAEIAGASRASVVRMRLVLVEWGFESLMAVSDAPGGVHRILQA